MADWLFGLVHFLPLSKSSWAQELQEKLDALEVCQPAVFVAAMCGLEWLKEQAGPSGGRLAALPRSADKRCRHICRRRYLVHMNCSSMFAGGRGLDQVLPGAVLHRQKGTGIEEMECLVLLGKVF